MKEHKDHGAQNSGCPRRARLQSVCDNSQSRGPAAKAALIPKSLTVRLKPCPTKPGVFTHTLSAPEVTSLAASPRCVVLGFALLRRRNGKGAGPGADRITIPGEAGLDSIL